MTKPINMVHHLCRETNPNHCSHTQYGKGMGKAKVERDNNNI